MHDGAEDLQGLEPAAAQSRRVAALLAALIGLAPTVAGAEPTETVRPVVARRGWQVDLTGWVQVDSTPWSEESIDELDPSTGEPLSTEKFVIRRGRLRAEARRDNLFGSFELDGNTINRPTARILAAQVGYQFPAREPEVVIAAGLFRVPFGMEVPMSERVKPFLEPPAFARAMFPGNYDAGVTASGRFGLARWSLALVNGAMVADRQWTGADPSSSYDLVGRIGAVIEGPRRFRVEVGVSGLTGSGLHPGTPPTKDELQWLDENQDGIVQDTELQVLPGTPGLPSESFGREAIGADLQLHWCLCKLGTGTAFVEGVLASNLDRGLVYSDPVTSDRELRQAGFAVGALQNVGAHALVGVRYDRYDADRDAIQRAGIDLIGVDKVFSTLSVMVSGHWHQARLVAQFDRQRNPFGRADDGTPTTRDADRLMLRAQVGW